METFEKLKEDGMTDDEAMEFMLYNDVRNPSDSDLFIDKIYNESCIETMKRLPRNSIDCVITSPFYNTNEKAGKSRTLQNTAGSKGYPYVRYDKFIDTMTDKEYEDFIVECFNGFSKIVKNNGVVLWQVSYGVKGMQPLINLMFNLSNRTEWTCIDEITWRKKTALPNNCSCNRLTRICEKVYVMCRKNEVKSFYANKTVVSVRKTGQKSYENITNYIEAANNDGSNPLNKATFSVELVEKLMNIYVPVGGAVYDPFMGTGTTAVACKLNCRSYCGFEISEVQCKYANERLDNIE